MTNRAIRSLLLIGALGSGAAAQRWFARDPLHLGTGAALYGVAAVLFLLATSSVELAEAAPAPEPARLLVSSARLRFALLAAALASSGVVTGLLGRPSPCYALLFAVWVAALVAYLAAFAAAPRETLRIARRRLRDSPSAALLVALVLAVALALRAWRIGSIPWTLAGDEGSQGLWARKVLAGEVVDPFGAGWLSVPNLSFFWQAAWFRVLGDDIPGLRLPWAILGTATVGCLYALVRRLFDAELALLAAFLLASYHFHVHYSRIGSNQIGDAFFMTAALACLAGGAARGRSSGWSSAGIVAGLAFYFYAGSRQVVIVLAAVALWTALGCRRPPARIWRGAAAMVGGFLVAAAPMLGFAVRHPDDFNARLNAVGLFQSGLADRLAAATQGSRWTVLAEQAKRAFLAFNVYPDQVSWYGAAIPLMDFAPSILFVLGGAACVWRARDWRFGAFAIWLALVLFLGGALTENPPSSQRIVSSAVPAVVFVAVALRLAADALRTILRAGTTLRRAALAAAALALSTASVRFYFGAYQASWVYGNANAEVATRLGHLLRDLGPDWVDYFFGFPRMYGDFASIPFIAKGVTIIDVREPLRGRPSFVDASRNALFVFLPERVQELDVVRTWFPTGQLKRIHRVDAPDGPLLFTVYEVRRADLLAAGEP